MATSWGWVSPASTVASGERAPPAPIVNASTFASLKAAT
jgi:hypothetical protein